MKLFVFPLVSAFATTSVAAAADVNAHSKPFTSACQKTTVGVPLRGLNAEALLNRPVPEMKSTAGTPFREASHAGKNVFVYVDADITEKTTPVGNGYYRESHSCGVAFRFVASGDRIYSVTVSAINSMAEIDDLLNAPTP